MVTNGANVAAKAVAVRAPRAFGGDARGFLSWFVPVVIAVGATAAAIARGLSTSHELWAVGVLLALSLLVGAQPYRLSASVRFPMLGSLLIVTAGMLGGPAGAAVVGSTIGLAGLRRSALPRGLAEAAGCALGGALAGLAAWRVLQGVEGLPPLVIIGASLCGASVLGLSRLAVDQLFWRGAGSRSSETAVVYRLAVAADVLLAGLFASALVGIVHVWGTLALVATTTPVVVSLVGFRWYRERQSLSEAALAQSWSEAEERARLDGLTGVANRRQLDETLAADVSRAQRTHSAVSFVLLDLDHFKQLNDTHGHLTGDAVLVEAARRLSARARGGDLVARYGGEEFAVILADLDSDLELARTAEALRMAIAEEPFTVHDQVLRVTASAGAVHAWVTEPSELIAAADDALYRAKRRGRDQTITAPVPGER
jgi:diguanylate cyclase (GGDEF)-like protein